MALDTVTLGGRPMVDTIRAAARAGFRGLELRDPSACEVDRRLVQEWRDSAGSSGIRLMGACPGPAVEGWHRGWGRQFGVQLARKCDAYAALGLHWVVFPAPARADSVQELAKHYRDICRVCADHGLYAGLEFVAHVDTGSDILAAYRAVEDVDEPNAGLVLDLLHFFLGGCDKAALSQMDGRLILLVHLCDAKWMPRQTLSPVRHRVYCGQGQIDVVDLVARVHSTGFRGPYVVELFNEAYWSAPPHLVARRAFRTAKTCLRRAGVAASSCHCWLRDGMVQWGTGQGAGGLRARLKDWLRMP